MDRRADIGMAAAVALFGIFVLYSAQLIRPASVFDPIGSSGLPKFVGVVLILGGLILVARRLVHWRRETTLVRGEGVEDDLSVVPGSALRAISLWATAFAYVQAMSVAGYLIATPVFVAVGLALLGMRRPAMIALIAIGFTIPVFLTFTLFLNVRLPTGVLDTVLRQWGLV